MDDGKRVLIISPVRNEAAHIETLARSLQAQDRPPDHWIVVDDNSTDETPDLLARLEAELPFMSVVSTPSEYTRDAGDRHAVAAAPRAFNVALRTTDWQQFTHVGKLDADIELPPDYFTMLLAEFDRDPQLGIGGGMIIEQVGEEWRLMRTAPDAVRGALKLYSRACFEAIGGVREHLGWDGVDQTYAMMRGYRTHSFEHIIVRHHRACGSADGLLKGRVRGGETYYVVGWSFPWMLGKSVKQSRLRPIGLSGLAFVYGYVRAALRSVPRVADEDYRQFLRQRERRRMLHALTRAPLPRRG